MLLRSISSALKLSSLSQLLWKVLQSLCGFSGGIFCYLHSFPLLLSCFTCKCLHYHNGFHETEGKSKHLSARCFESTSLLIKSSAPSALERAHLHCQSYPNLAALQLCTCFLLQDKSVEEDGNYCLVSIWNKFPRWRMPSQIESSCKNNNAFQALSSLGFLQEGTALRKRCHRKPICCV